MDEKEMLDMMLSERIDMLLRKMNPVSKAKERETALLMQHAEILLKRLPHDDWKILSQYMDHQNDRVADEASYLYSCGITDGIRLMKYIESL